MRRTTGDLLTIAPDYRVQVRSSILLEHDDAMLMHGLQEMHGAAT